MKPIVQMPKMDVVSAVAALKTDDTAARMKAASELGFMRSDAAEAVPALVDAA